MEQAVTFMSGISFLTIGLSYLIHGRDWSHWLKAVREHERLASLSLGMVTLLLGGLIVGFHWKWAGLPLVLSIVGVLMMLKGIVYLLFPGWLPAKLKWLERHYRLVLPFSGIVTVVVALAILCEWQQLAYPEYAWQSSAWISQ